MRLTIMKGRTILYRINLRSGWNRISDKLGAKLLANKVVVLFNCGGAIRCDQIILETLVSRVSANLLGTKRTFGTVNECIPPRQIFVMRMSRVPSAVTGMNRFWYGNRSCLFSSKLAHLASIPYPVRYAGMYPVTGERQPNAPGGKDIEPVSGQQRDLQWLIQRSDAEIHRCPLAWLDMNTGEPIQQLNQEYHEARGWNKSTQIAEVCRPADPNNPYNENRVPLVANEGVCAYEQDLCGMNRYDSWLVHDWQHGIRMLAAVIAAADNGDLAAAEFLKIAAADARYCRPVLPDGPAGEGSLYYGTRECSWQITAWLRSRATFEHAQTACDRAEHGQMVNGCFAALPGSYPFSPPPGGDPNWRWQPSMELWFMVHALALAGRTGSVKKAMLAVFENPRIKQLGYIPKYFRVSVRPGQIEETLEAFSGGPDFFPWIAIPIYAILFPDDPRWKEWCLMIPTPSQGKAITAEQVKAENPEASPAQVFNIRMDDLKLRLSKEVQGAQQVVAIRSVLQC